VNYPRIQENSSEGLFDEELSGEENTGEEFFMHQLRSIPE
jgi:hypothetical protein